MTLFEALTGGAFDRLNWQHSGEFDQKFLKKSNAPGFARGGGAGLELTGTLRVGINWETDLRTAYPYISIKNSLQESPTSRLKTNT